MCFHFRKLCRLKFYTNYFVSIVKGIIINLYEYFISIEMLQVIQLKFENMIVNILHKVLARISALKDQSILLFPGII